MATIVSLEKVENKLFTVKIKREFTSDYETKQFTQKEFEQYLEQVQDYCKHKGYDFIFNDNKLFPVGTPKRGGRREGSGRPALGTTRKVSLTLPDEIWSKIEEIKAKKGETQSAALRGIIEDYFKAKF